MLVCLLIVFSLYVLAVFSFQMYQGNRLRDDSCISPELFGRDYVDYLQLEFAGDHVVIAGTQLDAIREERGDPVGNRVGDIYVERGAARHRHTIMGHSVDNMYLSVQSGKPVKLTMSATLREKTIRRESLQIVNWFRSRCGDPNTVYESSSTSDRDRYEWQFHRMTFSILTPGRPAAELGLGSDFVGVTLEFVQPQQSPPNEPR